MNKDQAVKGYDLVCEIRSHEYAASKLEQDKAIIAAATDTATVSYEINKTKYPKDVGVRVLELLIDYHKAKIGELTEQLSKL
ncbi:MAG TPA: hypothetical protein VN038_01320 [Dyadobacter sp.]|nr:hypothetical protein [Dyadobacter sp.]